MNYIVGILCVLVFHLEISLIIQTQINAEQIKLNQAQMEVTAGQIELNQKHNETHALILSTDRHQNESINNQLDSIKILGGLK